MALGSIALDHRNVEGRMPTIDSKAAVHGPKMIEVKVAMIWYNHSNDCNVSA
jgi:hypothetical protein